MADQRLFTRVIFSTPARLVGKFNSWKTSLIDLSLKGALLQTPEDWLSEGEYTSTDHFELIFSLAGSDIDIKMQMRIVHEEDNHLGFSCDSIDIDSATHLRRLIELNVGNEELLHRNLEHLSHPEST